MAEDEWPQKGSEGGKVKSSSAFFAVKFAVCEVMKHTDWQERRRTAQHPRHARHLECQR